MTADKLQGALDLLILKVLARESTHGYGVTLRVKQLSGDVLQVEEGSLYPALHRMERDGWIAAEWRASENNRRAKFYRITPAGRKRLEAEEKSWARVTGAVARVLRTA
ncbi:MAG TPA: PadR family transcriptional regulator [Candidatus Acidoferrales bacterium]|nr:PadR family transcriptional regulator [Candidatus Acidoferrales bacterium]